MELGLWSPNHVPGYLLEDYAKLDVPLRHSIASLGGIAVTADWHHPVTDYGLVNSFLDRCTDLGVRNLAVVGDWFNMDSLSRFDDKQATATLVREIEYSTQTMAKVGECFDRIYFTWGNHDARFHTALAGKVQFTQAMKMLFSEVAPAVVDKIIFSNLDHMIVETPNDDPMDNWYLAHPKAYSSVPLTNARKLASKYLMNVATGHSHHTAVGHDVSGRFICAELGGFFDAKKTNYLQRSTAFPEWQNGWATIDDHGHFQMEGFGWSTGWATRN